MATATKSPPTSSEVARRAGVSRTTVSCVLNDVRDQSIGDATRAKVLATAREMGHQRIAYVSYAPPEYDNVNGREATRRLIARGGKFTALFAGNDTIAFGAIRALNEAGLRVPHDVALVGYDDIPLAAFASPPLTTMRSDPISHGKDAMQLLWAQLNPDAGVPAPRHERSARLVIRESCGARLKKKR